MSGLIGLIILVAALLSGYSMTRKFVRERLRYVNAAQKPMAALIAGAAAWIVSLPVFGLLSLPFLGAGSAFLFGVSVGAGARAGSNDTRRAAGYIEGS